jgi:hypothetical protein
MSSINNILGDACECMLLSGSGVANHGVEVDGRSRAPPIVAIVAQSSGLQGDSTLRTHAPPTVPAIGKIGLPRRRINTVIRGCEALGFVSQALARPRSGEAGTMSELRCCGNSPFQAPCRAAIG